jgi:hypothetical protein
MHPPQIVRAIQDLFEEEVNICKRKPEKSGKIPEGQEDEQIGISGERTASEKKDKLASSTCAKRAGDSEA